MSNSLTLGSITPSTRVGAAGSDASGAAAKAAALATAAASASSGVASAPEVDVVTQLPVPPRFPWLTRLSAQLESASRQRPAFTPAPVLGDNVNQAA